MHHWRILLDLDGTVAQNASRRVAERTFGVTIGPERAAESLMEILGISREEFWVWWHSNQDEIYGQAVMLPGAAETLQLLKRAGAYIAVVTARRSMARSVTQDWLHRHAIPFDTMVMDADDKVPLARELGLNVGFEDDPAHALPLADLFPMGLIYNNKNLGQELMHPQLQRLSGWSEVLPWLHGLAARSA